MVLNRYEQRRVQELNKALEDIDFHIAKRKTRQTTKRLEFELVVKDEADTVGFTDE